jgi:carbon storage regulator
MLVLSRKTNEEIIIQDNITIKVLDINENGVKIGINAPKNITVHRKEIYQEIQKENMRASQAPLDFDVNKFLKERT